MKVEIMIDQEVYDNLLVRAKDYGASDVESFLEHIADSVSSGKGCIATSLKKSGSVAA